jgi:hypothetical protein
MDAQVAKLSESLVDELVGAVGLPKTRFYHALFWRLFRRITTALAVLGVPFDQKTGDEGLPAASAWLLEHFCKDIFARGTENLPARGPLLVISNHPGAYDALIVFSHLNRKDILWISTEIPFLELLPNTHEHILFSSRKDTTKRMIAMRNAVRHLKNGGILVYLAAGHRDPDPAVFPGAAEAMDKWLDVFDSFCKYVPDLTLIPVVVSGVVSKHWSHHPLTWLRRNQIDKSRLAEFGQVISQLLHPGRYMISPSLSFGQPFTEQELRRDVGEGKLLPAVIIRGKQLLNEHCAVVGDCTE